MHNTIIIGYNFAKEDQNDSNGSTKTLVGGIEGTITNQVQMACQGER